MQAAGGIDPGAESVVLGGVGDLERVHLPVGGIPVAEISQHHPGGRFGAHRGVAILAQKGETLHFQLGALDRDLLPAAAHRAADAGNAGGVEQGAAQAVRAGGADDGVAEVGVWRHRLGPQHGLGERGFEKMQPDAPGAGCHEFLGMKSREGVPVILVDIVILNADHRG
jgi:hypothetical protein